MVFGTGHLLMALILDQSKITHANDIGPEHDFGDGELTLFSFYIQLLFQQSRQYSFNMVHLTFNEWGIDQNIISVGQDKISQHVTKNIINECLQHRGDIGKSICYHTGLIMAKSHLPLISLMDVDNIIGTSEIELSQNTSILELFQSGSG